MTLKTTTQKPIHLKSFVPLSVKTTIRVLGAAVLKATTSPWVILSRESLPPSNDSNFKFAVARPNSWNKNIQTRCQHQGSDYLDIRCVKYHFNILLDVWTVVIEGNKGIPKDIMICLNSKVFTLGCSHACLWCSRPPCPSGWRSSPCPASLTWLCRWQTWVEGSAPDTIWAWSSHFQCKKKPMIFSRKENHCHHHHSNCTSSRPDCPRPEFDDSGQNLQRQEARHLQTSLSSLQWCWWRLWWWWWWWRT